VEILLRGPADPDTGDAPLPADLSQDALRPLLGLERSLQCACWRLATHVGKPTGHLVGQIVRVVKGAIHQGQGNNGSNQPEPKRPPRQTYLSSIYRLSAPASFSAQIVILQVNDSEAAKRCATNCRVLINRCEAILRELSHRFPEL
jgi:hypothetical protein